MKIENNLLGNAKNYSLMHTELMNIELDIMQGLYRNLKIAGSITKKEFNSIMKKIDDERNSLNGKNRVIK